MMRGNPAKKRKNLSLKNQALKFISSCLIILAVIVILNI